MTISSGTSAARGHDVLGLQPDRRAGRDRGAQHVAGGELHDAMTFDQSMRLRSLAGPGRPEKN